MSNPQHRIEKLRLKRGDIIVCRDFHTAEALSKMRFPFLSFQVPIVVAPQGLQAIPVEELERIARDVRQESRIIIPNKF